MTDDYITIPIKDYPPWLKIDGNLQWPYVIKSENQKKPKMNYSKKLIDSVAHYRSQGMSFGKIADILGENRERIRNICETRLEEK